MAENLEIHPSPNDIRTEVLESLENAPRERGPCISIYLPRQSAGFGPAQRKYAFVRLLKQAEKLIAQDRGVMTAREIIADFWRTSPLDRIQQSGLALAFFHSSDVRRSIHLPMDVQERVVVAESFHIKPILGWLQASPQFYLISLSGERVKIFESTPWDLRLLRVIGNEDEQEPETPLRDRYLGHGRGGRPRRDHSKISVRRFFLRAEREIGTLLNQSRIPIVLAGVSWLHPIYRRVSQNPDLLTHSIYGNVERWSEEELRQAILEAAGKLVERSKQDVIREFQDLSYTGRASDDLTDIARAAIQGRVRKIMIASDQMLFGRIDATTGAVTLHSEQLNSSDDDVLDDLAETVLARGGNVLCVPSRDMPTLSPALAVLSA